MSSQTLWILLILSCSVNGFIEPDDSLKKKLTISRNWTPASFRKPARLLHSTQLGLHDKNLTVYCFGEKARVYRGVDLDAKALSASPPNEFSTSKGLAKLLRRVEPEILEIRWGNAERRRECSLGDVEELCKKLEMISALHSIRLQIPLWTSTSDGKIALEPKSKRLFECLPDRIERLSAVSADVIPMLEKRRTLEEFSVVDTGGATCRRVEFSRLLRANAHRIQLAERYDLISLLKHCKLDDDEATDDDDEDSDDDDSEDSDDDEEEFSRNDVLQSLSGTVELSPLNVELPRDANSTDEAERFEKQLEKYVKIFTALDSVGREAVVEARSQKVQIRVTADSTVDQVVAKLCMLTGRARRLVEEVQRAAARIRSVEIGVRLELMSERILNDAFLTDLVDKAVRELRLTNTSLLRENLHHQRADQQNCELSGGFRVGGAEIRMRVEMVTHLAFGPQRYAQIVEAEKEKTEELVRRVVGMLKQTSGLSQSNSTATADSPKQIKT